MTIRAQRVAGFAVAALTALLFWLGGLAGLAAAAGPSGDYLAIGPRRTLFPALASSGARFLRETSGGLLLSGDGPATVRALYANGAWLVLPAPRGGCLAFGRRPDTTGRTALASARNS
jgi:hypothetical protein